MGLPAGHFNPRSREGSDPYSTSSYSGWRYFNPRSREGSDIYGTNVHGEREKFQSTLP